MAPDVVDSFLRVAAELLSAGMATNQSLEEKIFLVVLGSALVRCASFEYVLALLEEPTGNERLVSMRVLFPLREHLSVVEGIPKNSMHRALAHAPSFTGGQSLLRKHFSHAFDAVEARGEELEHFYDMASSVRVRHDPFRAVASLGFSTH